MDKVKILKHFGTTSLRVTPKIVLSIKRMREPISRLQGFGDSPSKWSTDSDELSKPLSNCR